MPVEKMTEPNANIVSKIQMVDAFYGDKYGGIKPEKTGLKGLNITLANLWNITGLTLFWKSFASISWWRKGQIFDFRL